MFVLSQLERPVVAAPMAGGPSTPALVTAVAGAGALGFLAAGYKSVDALAGEIAAVRGVGPFGVNLFVPGPAGAPVDAYREELRTEAERYGVTLPEVDPDDTDGWAAKLDLLWRDPVPVVSFTFGLPEPAIIARFHEVGTHVAVTVTNPQEAERSQAHGADSLCVQGPDGGGHRGTHRVADEPDRRDLEQLLTDVRSVTTLPLIAAGGIGTPERAAAVLDRGAEAIQIGTLLLRTPEAGTSDLYRRALAEGSTTALTRAFTGRVARGLANRFLREHSATAPAAYPQVHQLPDRCGRRRWRPATRTGWRSGPACASRRPARSPPPTSSVHCGRPLRPDDHPVPRMRDLRRAYSLRPLPDSQCRSTLRRQPGDDLLLLLRTRVLQPETEEQQRLLLGYGRVLPQFELVPLGGRDMPPYEGKRVRLLVGEVLLRGRAELADQPGQLVAVRHLGPGTPPGPEFRRVLRHLAQHAVLAAHPVDCPPFEVDPSLDSGPQQVVLARVMVEQGGRHVVEVLRHDRGPADVAVPHCGDQHCEQPELAPVHLVRPGQAPRVQRFMVSSHARPPWLLNRLEHATLSGPQWKVVESR